MIPVHSQPIIDIGLFEQNNGWIFIGVHHDTGFINKPLFSGKRGSLAEAMSSGKEFAGSNVSIIFLRLDHV